MPAESIMVTVVIPTAGRNEVFDAVLSAQQQTYSQFEIIVVQDGPNDAIRTRLESQGDPRVKVITLSSPGGGAAARNLGVQHACGYWVAFLDDDDTFLPSKLAAQVQLAVDQIDDNFLVVCSAIVMWSGKQEVWPRRFPADGEPWSDYLFAREWVTRRAFLQTSCWLAPKSLLIRIPINEKLTQHQDWDWLMEADAMRVRLIPVQEPLVRYQMQPPQIKSITTGSSWARSLDWVRRHHSKFRAETYAFFVAINVAGRARREHALSLEVLSIIFREFWVIGKPTVLATLFLGINLLDLGQFIRWCTTRNIARKTT